MKTIITGKDMVISNAISERVLKKTAKMERYLDPNTELLVRLTKKKDGRRKCEITVPFEGVTLRAEASSDDNLYVSIDQALAKLERQIHKHRTKLQSRFRSDAFKAMELEYVEEPVSEQEDEPKVVRHKTFPVSPMSVEDAVMHGASGPRLLRFRQRRNRPHQRSLPAQRRRSRSPRARSLRHRG